MEKNILETVVIPEVPKVIPNQELFVYVPIATDKQKGIASFDINSLIVQNGHVKVKKEYIDNLIEANEEIKRLYQTKRDDNVQDTRTKFVVQAINNNRSDIKDLSDVVDGQVVQIAINTQDIADLKDTSTSGKKYIGSITKEVLPSYNAETGYTSEFIAELNALANNAPNQGDYVDLYIQNVDKFSLYIIAYTNGKWNKYDLQAPITKGTNDRFGVIRGTLNDSGADILLDLQDGKFVDMYVKTKVFANADSYKTIATILNELNSRLNGFLDGTSDVEFAKRALADQYGHRIDTSYAKLDDVYTKNESDEKFLSSTYSNTYYYAKPISPTDDGLVDTIPTQAYPQFTITTTQILDNFIFEVFRRTIGKYKFTKNSTDRSVIWISSDVKSRLNFRLTTSVEIDGQVKVLATDLSGDVEFIENIPTPITFNTNYGMLGDEVIEVPVRSKIIKKLEVIAPDSSPYTVSVWSNETFTSTFQLLAQGLTFDVNTVNGKVAIEKKVENWIELGPNNWLVQIIQAEHRQAPSTEYGIEVQRKLTNGSYQNVVCSPVIHENGLIDIFSETPLDIRVLVWSAFKTTESEVMRLKNPGYLEAIDYGVYGGLQVLQTVKGSYLVLPTPTNPNFSYRFFVSNSVESTEPITVNDNVINAGKGVEFIWTGDWVTQLNPILTSEIEDDVNGQALNTTLLDLEDYCNNLDATKADKDSVTQNATNISLLGANKQNATIEKVDGNFIGTTMEEFRTHFYELRKDPTRTWQYEVSSSSNIDLMDILTWPEGNGKSAFVYVTLPYSEAGGFEIALTYMGRNGFPIYKRTMSGTLNANWKDTGWYTLRPRWVDNVNGDVTLVDTTEISMDIGEFKNPYGNALIMEITKNAHSYNSFLLLDKASSQKGETTVKLDNEDVYISIDYDTKKFKISKNSQGTETVKLHIYEEV